MKPKQEIEKHKPQEELPQYLQRPQGQPAAGFEEVDHGDMTVPQLRLCQSLTPQRQEGEAKYIEGLREGEHFNTVTGSNYGKLVQIVPLMFYKNRIRFATKDTGGGILCRSEDMKTGTGDPGGNCAKCPYNQFGSAKDGKGKGKACTEFYNFPAMVVDENGEIHPRDLVVKSFKSSGVPVAKDWLALMRLRGIDMFGGVYDLSSVSKKFQEGTSYLETIKNTGIVKPEIYVAAKQMYTMFAEMRAEGRIKVDEADQVEEFPEPGSAG